MYGKVGSSLCSMLLDSGANITVETDKQFKPDQYLPDKVQMTGVNGVAVAQSKEKVWLQFYISGGSCCGRFSRRTYSSLRLG